MRQRPKTSALMLTTELLPLVAAAVANDCISNHDKDAGTIQVRDGDLLVISAIQKGDSKQPWIVMFFETDRIRWGAPR